MFNVLRTSGLKATAQKPREEPPKRPLLKTSNAKKLSPHRNGCRERSVIYKQRWSWGTKARGQGQGHNKIPRLRPRTALARTDPLEAKNRNARGQGQGPSTLAQVLSKKKRKKIFNKIFQAISEKKKGFHKSFSGNLQKKKVFQKIMQALHKILTIQKIGLSSGEGQDNFRELEASRPRT